MAFKAPADPGGYGGALQSYWTMRAMLEENHIQLLQEIDTLFWQPERSCLPVQSKDGGGSKLNESDILVTKEVSKRSGNSSSVPSEVNPTDSMMPGGFMGRQSYYTSQVEKKRSARAVPQRARTPGSEANFQAQRRRRSLRRLVSSATFEAVSCWLIFINAIVYGIETQYLALSETQTYAPLFLVIGHVFTMLFTAEIVLRLHSDARGFFCSKQWLWNLLDLGLVILSLVESGCSLVGDEDHTGMITLSMFEESLRDDQVRAYFDGLDLTTDDAWNLFKLLDTNESNSIDLQEFVGGCLRLRGRARSIDIHMLLHHSQWTMKRLGDILEKLAGSVTPHSPTPRRGNTRRLSRRSSGSMDGSIISCLPGDGSHILGRAEL